MAKTKSEHLKVFFSPCFLGHLFLPKTIFFPASPKYFHVYQLEIFSKNKRQPKVAMLAIYERYDVLEALKSGSSGDDFGWISAGKILPKGIFEVDFC